MVKTEHDRINPPCAAIPSPLWWATSIRFAYSLLSINIDHIILAKARIQRKYDCTPSIGLMDMQHKEKNPNIDDCAYSPWIPAFAGMTLS